MRIIITSLSLVSILSFTACKKKDDAAASAGGGAAKAAESGGETKPAAAPAWKKVASMGIEVQVAADADVQDNTKSAGFPSSTIYSTDGTPTMFIFGAKDLADSMTLSKDFDSTKTRVQKEMNGFKKFTKEEKTADGFVLTYTGASMGDPNATLYGVTMRSVVAGLTLDCQTNASSEAELAKAITLCKSIRAAK